jgi:hypothetical protein
MYKCIDCANHMTVVWESLEGDGIVYQVYPPAGNAIEAHGSWPERVASAYAQAAKALEVESWDAAGAMARRAVQAAIRNLGANPGNVKAEIDELGKAGVLAPSLVQWAHEVRVLAQVAAHPDEDEPPVSAEDARDAVEFTKLFLTYVYSIPAEIEELRERRRTAVTPPKSNQP